MSLDDEMDRQKHESDTIVGRIQRPTRERRSDSDFLCLVTRGDMDDVIEKGFGQRSRLAAADGRALVYIVN